MKHSPGFLQLVKDKLQHVTEVTVDDIRPRLPARDFHLVDVREESEWHAGHLPSARHLSKGLLERDVEVAIPDKDAEIVLYCGGGFRSALAADALQQMGYTRVRSLAGGYSAWTGAGLPVDRPAEKGGAA
jgi:rhodanese-related sulfurtransferase